MIGLKIDVRDLHRSYGDNEVLKGITTRFHEGDVACIISPSGSGKSTFLCTLNLPETITSGRTTTDGHGPSDPKTDVNKIREDVGMVLQHFSLFPYMTVLKDITSAPIELGKENKEEAEKHATELLEQVGSAGKHDAKPKSLPRGQKQRVTIARSLVMNPDIMLFDEPTSTLGPEMVGDAPNVMRNLAKQGMTMLVVTHEMGFACKIANRVIFIDGGGLLEDGTPKQIFDSPQHPHLKNFLDKTLNA